VRAKRESSAREAARKQRGKQSREEAVKIGDGLGVVRIGKMVSLPPENQRAKVHI
jgi:hypothetical protein